RVRSGRVGREGKEDQAATAKPVGGVNSPPLAPTGFRLGLAGRHLAPLDRRAVERRRPSSVWRSALRSDRPKRRTVALRASVSSDRRGAPWQRFVWSCRENPDPAGRRRVKRSADLRPKGLGGQQHADEAT